MAEKLLTVKEVAQYLGVRPVTIYAWVKQRRIPHIPLSIGKRKECVRFRRESLEAWLRNREREAKGFTKWDLR